MALLSSADFVTALQHSPFLLPEFRTQLVALQEQFTDPIRLGEELIRRGLLTPLQADRIIRGRQNELSFGRYQLVDRLGEGGYGQVFKAWDAENSRFVALKILRGELVTDPETVSRFHREISVSGRLPPHPCLIRTLDSGRVGESHFLAMVFIEGMDLDRLVEGSGPLPVQQACEFIRQAALGLQHAHEHGLVHRDIKPSNLMVSGPGNAAVKILDLGLARLHVDSGPGRENTFMTSDGSVTLGTVDYQAPEQALDFHAADIRADIYSLGCTLYFLLTGSPPFGDGPLAVKLMRHQQADPPDLRELRPDVPPGLIPIVQRMLAKEPDERYATPGEVAMALAGLNRPPRKRLPWLLVGSLGMTVFSLLLLFAVLPSRPTVTPSVRPAPRVAGEPVQEPPKPVARVDNKPDPAVAIRREPRVLTTPDNRPGAAGKPIQVFILMGETNMMGMGDIGPETVKGTLAYLTKAEKKYPFLLDGDKWAERKDVYYCDARVKKGVALSPIANNGKWIGPELGFGYVMGHVFDEPVLVLKSSTGNRSLGWDFVPPGSNQFNFEGRTYAGYKDSPESWVAGQPKKGVNWYAGKQYDDDVASAKDALKSIAEWYPGYKDQGYEIVGIVWWQGHKDSINAAHASRYEDNLVRLIESLRKDYAAPRAKFVLATGCGNPGREGLGLQIAEAQLAIGDTRKYPKFAGNVKAVDSRDLWREAAVSPKNQGYHYNHNAETYLEVGIRLGWAMAEILEYTK